jgi:hypothetical protein
MTLPSTVVGGGEGGVGVVGFIKWAMRTALRTAVKTEPTIPATHFPIHPPFNETVELSWDN